jgi:hypothetical protein
MENYSVSSECKEPLVRFRKWISAKANPELPQSMSK